MAAGRKGGRAAYMKKMRQQTPKSGLTSTPVRMDSMMKGVDWANLLGAPYVANPKKIHKSSAKSAAKRRGF
jgi:hypothetical protein